MKTLLLTLSLFAQSHAPETFSCNVTSLDEYGFIQTSNNTEYVCKNPYNDVDFVVTEDENNNLKINDKMYIMLNKHGEVTSMIKR